MRPQSPSRGTKLSGRAAQASPFTTAEGKDSPERGGYFPKPHRELMVGLGLATPTPCSVSSGEWECHPNPQPTPKTQRNLRAGMPSEDPQAYLRDFTKPMKSSTKLCVASMSHGSRVYTAFISLNEAQNHVSIAGEGRKAKSK